MPVGFEGSGGVMAGYQALAQIIAERKKDELIRQKEIEDARQFDLQQRQLEEQTAWRQQQQEKLDHYRERQEARQDRQDIIGEGSRIQATTPIGASLAPDQIVTLIKAGDQSVLKPTPILTMPGIVEKLGAKPTQTETGGQLIYGGNAAQQHTAQTEELATLRYEEQKRQAAAAAARANRGLEISEARLDLAEDRAGEEINIVERQPDGTYAVVATAPRGSRIAPNPETTFQRNQKASRTAAASTVQALAELSERINVNQGVVAKITGTAERAKAAANLNDDVAEYEALAQSFTPMVARAQGHTGVLTQQDVDSARAIFPKPTDSKSLRDRKVKRIWQLIGEEGEAPAASPTVTTPGTAPGGKFKIERVVQ